MRNPFTSKLIAQIAPTMGIKVELEPDYQFAGELIFEDGNRHLFRNTNFNVNPAASTEIAKDKAYTNYFLGKHGFNVPVNKVFFAKKINKNLSNINQDKITDAVNFAKKIGFPVYVKPNKFSLGTLVAKAYSEEDIIAIANRIFERSSFLLVEEACIGRDYRVVVFGDKVVSAYERIPLIVVGDAKHTISELIEIKAFELKNSNRLNSSISPSDFRIDMKLASLGMSKQYIPYKGEEITLLDNANLTTGGTSNDITDSIHASFMEIAVMATKTLGLTLCGVDILAEDLTRNASEQTWNIIEVNASPGLDNYASFGTIQAQRVEELYRQILEYLSTQKI